MVRDGGAVRFIADLLEHEQRLRAPRDQQRVGPVRAIRETADSREWNGTIVTQVKPFTVFYRAENYHQEYFKLHGEQPYCQLVVAPKVAKFRKKFHDFLK